MKYYYALYMDEKTSLKKDEIVEKIENNRFQFEKYVIALAKNEKNHLEIYNSVLLLQNMVEKEKQFVVGLAEGYEEALELVEKIAKEVYDETNGTDIRRYLLQKQQEYEEGNV